jgi:hypothetical protein
MIIYEKEIYQRILAKHLLDEKKQRDEEERARKRSVKRKRR